SDSIRILLDLGEERGLELTQAAERALAAGDDESVRCLLPLIQQSKPQPPAPLWADHPDLRLRRHALLMRAESSRLVDASTIPALAELLRSGPDRSRLRARLVLSSGVRVVEKTARGLRVSGVGWAAMDALAAEYVTSGERALNQVWADVTHDDGDALL